MDQRPCVRDLRLILGDTGVMDDRQVAAAISPSPSPSPLPGQGLRGLRWTEREQPQARWPGNGSRWDWSRHWYSRSPCAAWSHCGRASSGRNATR